jgi:hypothetical protein
MAEIDRMLEETHARIEEERQAALEAAGFADAQTEAQYQAQIDAAKESGDQILQYQLERRLQEKQINDQYDAQAKAAEKKAAKEKADIQYKVAQQEWGNKILDSIVSTAQAIMTTLAQMGVTPWGIAAAAIAGTMGGVQTGIIAGNPPKPPVFATGGLVLGDSYSGDKVNALVNSGELILNRAQQDTVAGQLAGGMQTIIIPLYLNGVEIARATADIFGSGQVLIPARGIDRR